MLSNIYVIMLDLDLYQMRSGVDKLV